MPTYKKLVWTQHSQIKMRQYGLSKQKLLGILAKPERKEKGIVLGTTAVMRTNKTWKPDKSQQSWHFDGPAIIAPKARLGGKPKRAPGEIWIMYRDVKDFRRIISAWRYPGVSKPGESIPIPEDIRQEILKMVE